MRLAFKAEGADEKRAEVLAAMRWTATIESVAFSTVGRDLGAPAEGYTHLYCAAVEDLAALEQYMSDPVH